MRFWLNFALYRLMEEAGANVTGAAVATEPVSVPDATGTSTPEPTATPSGEPSNDLFSALDEAMKGLEPQEEPAQAQQQPVEAQIPEQFQQALQISEFVTSPESVSQAVRAADEVWKVATGQLPARQMLEGFRQVNPQQFEAIKADLMDYLGVQGQQNSPLDELKQANPAAFEEIAKYYEQVTGKSLSGPVDPREQRLSAIEQRFAAEEKARQEAVVLQQQLSATEKTKEFLTTALKGAFAEGQEQRIVALLAAKGAFNDQTMREVLKGNTKGIEKALREVQKDEVAALKAYNANLIKKQRGLAGAVPAAGAPVKTSADAQKNLAPLPGETAAQHAERLWKAGLLDK